MSRERRWLGALLVALLAGAVWAGQAPVWRAVYPHLPSRIQAAPYRVQAWLTAHRTPVALPTAQMARPRVSPAARRPFESPTADGRPAATPAIPSSIPSRTPTVTGKWPAPFDPAADLPPRTQLAGAHHVYQTWNNCGPATVSLALAYVGHAVDQAEAARTLKPDPNDKNVGPDELAAFATSRGVGAWSRVNGSLDLLRSFLARGWPVIVEIWFVPEPGDEMGHYRLLVGYDKKADTFTSMDTFSGPEITVSAKSLEEAWRAFNRAYVVVFPAESASQVEAALGPDHDDKHMYEGAVEIARAEVDARGDAFAWFNLGSSLVGTGELRAAADAFDRARAMGLPWRMLWYQFGPFEAYAGTGRWDDVTALATANLANASNLEESHYWLGRASAAQGDREGAIRAWRRALDLHPGYAAARSALDVAEAAAR